MRKVVARTGVEPSFELIPGEQSSKWTVSAMQQPFTLIASSKMLKWYMFDYKKWLLDQLPLNLMVA